MSRVTPRFLAWMAAGVGVPFTAMGNVEEGQFWGPVPLFQRPLLCECLCPCLPQPICTPPEASWVGTRTPSLSLSLTQQHVGPKEASFSTCLQNGRMSVPLLPGSRCSLALKAGRNLTVSLGCPEWCEEHGLQGSFLRESEELPGWLGL